jgi:hypothetical protein
MAEHDDDFEDQDEQEGEPSEPENSLPTPEEMEGLMDDVGSLAPQDKPEAPEIGPPNTAEQLAKSPVADIHDLIDHEQLMDQLSTVGSSPRLARLRKQQQHEQGNAEQARFLAREEAQPRSGENLASYYTRMEEMRQAAHPERREAALAAFQGVPGLDAGEERFPNTDKADAASDREAGLQAAHAKLRDANVACLKLLIDTVLDHGQKIEDLTRVLDKGRQ